MHSFLICISNKLNMVNQVSHLPRHENHDATEINNVSRYSTSFLKKKSKVSKAPSIAKSPSRAQAKCRIS